jgi:RimJ/RimL family protein N-acetyltransferase
MLPDVQLTQVTREDVARIADWLQDREVNSSWYGADESGEPLHIGYSPKQMLKATEEEWREVFESDVRKIYSIHSSDLRHIGEGQMVIEAPLWEAQIFILVGRKELWYRGYGTAGLVKLLDLAFYTYGLHRAWVDIPEYNLPALHMCERIGFKLEGRMRGTHPKDGEWHDSLAMGLLTEEYARRRARLMAPEPAG